MAKNIYKLLLTLLLFAGVSVSAQVDTAFWFAVPKLAHTHQHWPIVLVVFNTEQQQATVTVTKANSGQQVGTTLTVPANGSQTMTLVSDEAGLTGFECEYNTTSPNGLYIHSNTRINAYVALQENNSEIYALKGGSGLGTQFFVPMQFVYNTGTGNQSDSYYGTCRNAVEIIATEDNTVVTITPSAQCGSHPANQAFTITLQKGQVFCLASNSQLPAGHLFGTIITSDKPIVVDMSDDSVNPGNGSSNYDLVADQLVPENLAGNEYVVIPSPSNASNSTTAGGLCDYAFIFVLEDNTDVNIYYKVNGTTAVRNYTNKMRGDTISFHFPNYDPAYIYSYHMDDNTGEMEPKKVIVFQLTGAGKELGGTQLPFINCTGSQNVTYRPLHHPNSNYPKYLYLILVCDQSVTNGFQIQTNTGNITINNSDWYDIPGSGMKCCRKDTSSYATSQYINISNSQGKFHVGMIDYNKTNAGVYSDCSIGYFSNYSSESVLKWDTTITHFNYCQGDTINFGFEIVDAEISRILAPNNFDIAAPPYWMLNAQPENSGIFTVYGSDNRDGCATQLQDSIEITIHPSVRDTIYDTICPRVTSYDGIYSDLFTFPAESLLTERVLIDSITLQTSGFGCDSLVILQLTLRDSVKQKVVYDSVCPGVAYSGFNGQFAYPPDSTLRPRTIIDTLHLNPLSAGACDSLLILHLLVRDSVFGAFSHTACRSYTYNGRTYTNDTVVRNIVLVGASSHGCDSIVTMDLTILEPSVEIVPSGDFCEDGELELIANSAYGDFSWNDDLNSTGQSITVTQPGMYSVTVTEGDCKAEDQYKVEACKFEVYMPNSITPTQSPGLNDYFYLPEYLHRFISEFEIEIFNRWGQLIYSSNDMNFKWYGNFDGNGDGTAVQVPGIYVWVIRYKNLDGKPFTKRGTVTVM